jgi:hypothetical protein
LARTSKIKSSSKTPSSRAKPATPVEERDQYYCCRCTRHFKRQKGNFPGSQSSLYRGNGGYLPICNECAEELFQHYKEILGDEREALHRFCLKFDIYWLPKIYDDVYKGNTSNSRIKGYIRLCNLGQYTGKTYDDTLDEEAMRRRGLSLINTEDADEDADEEIPEGLDEVIKPLSNKIDNETVSFWGPGLMAEQYLQLEDRRKYWMTKYPKGYELDPGEEAILRQICNLEVSINRDSVSNKSLDKSVNALNTLLGSMNLKPSQKKESEDTFIPFGVEIARFENEHPIIEDDPELTDVDGIRKNLLAWFLGPLCKTAGIKNMYSGIYDDEIAKYTIERPNFDDQEFEDYSDEDTESDADG